MPRILEVLKSDQVMVSGSVRLGLGKSGSPVRAQNSAQTAGHADAGESPPQEVRIVESNSEYAIIEVVCGCGRKCHVQCNYADVAAGGSPNAQSSTDSKSPEKENEATENDQ
jgi:hypothetical protein